MIPKVLSPGLAAILVGTLAIFCVVFAASEPARPKHEFLSIVHSPTFGGAEITVFTPSEQYYSANGLADDTDRYLRKLFEALKSKPPRKIGTNDWYDLVDVLNYFGQEGWDLAGCTSETSVQGGNRVRYVMKRTK